MSEKPMAWEPVADEYMFLTDGCHECGAGHSDLGCACVLPVVVIVDEAESAVRAAYRCPHGHDWTATYEQEFALIGSANTQSELGEHGSPHWPPTGIINH